jgi:hypothetical protein
LRPLDFESSASANSATLACGWAPEGDAQVEGKHTSLRGFTLASIGSLRLSIIRFEWPVLACSERN